jgi:diguanylate cyclase (GGDEF)-like protein
MDEDRNSAPDGDVQDTHGENSALRVLVVDDDPALIALVAPLLAREGYEVCTAASGTEARRLLLEEGADVLITDWIMPEMDGLELCRAVRAVDVFGFIYVMMITAHKDRLSVVEALDAGADDFLAKPFDCQELLARVRVGCRIVRLERNLAQRTREVQHYGARLQILNNELNSKSITDELTGLYNRRHAMERLTELWALSERRGCSLSCIIFDIDHFKQVNDRYGHAAGDAVLKETAHVVSKTLRASDPVFRVGGEEFLILCPNSDARTTEVAAARVMRRVREHDFICDDLKLHVTVSLGVAQRQADMVDHEDLLRAADEALYEAKREGRDRVCVATGESVATVET